MDSNYIFSLSRDGRSRFFLNRLNQARNLEKDFQECALRLLEVLAECRLAEILREDSDLSSAVAAVQQQQPKFWHWILDDRSLSSMETLVLIVITKSSTWSGECDQTVGQLAAKAKVSDRTIYRVLKELRRKGYISRVRTGRADLMRIVATRGAPASKQGTLPPVSMNLPGVTRPAFTEPEWARQKREREEKARAEGLAGAGPVSTGTMPAEVVKRYFERGKKK